MKKIIIGGPIAVMALAAGSVALAQDSVDGTDTEAAEETSNGAIVVREDITEDVVDEEGNPVPALDDNGDPVLDDDGNPVFETVTTGFVQTVETPSGNIHTITKEEGSRAIVTHEFADRPERAARAERPERPEKPEKPEKPERPERPEKPERPDKPGRP